MLTADGTPGKFIEHAVEHLCCSRNYCFNPAKRLLQQYAEYRKAQYQPASGAILLDRGLVHIHRVQVTPLKSYFDGPEINVSNCVVRNYIEDLDNFIQVTSVDENGERVHSIDLSPRRVSADSDKHTNVYKRILSTSRNGIVVGDKKFEFLAFSSNQLRESSVWMSASRTGLNAGDIRKWMGDFSSVRNAVKFGTRLDQSLSSSTESPTVQKHEAESIHDVANNASYVFSDGLGKISAEFSGEAARSCDMHATPSVFQIRYGGHKGVVVVDPRSEMELSLRDGMCKFKSDNTKLDVLAYNKFNPNYMPISSFRIHRCQHSTIRIWTTCVGAVWSCPTAHR